LKERAVPRDWGKGEGVPVLEKNDVGRSYTWGEKKKRIVLKFEFCRSLKGSEVLDGERCPRDKGKRKRVLKEQEWGGGCATAGVRIRREGRYLFRTQPNNPWKGRRANAQGEKTPARYKRKKLEETMVGLTTWLKRCDKRLKGEKGGNRIYQ